MAKHKLQTISANYLRKQHLTWIMISEDHSFPRASLSENCFLLGTDNVCGQIYPLPPVVLIVPLRG